MFNPRKWQVEAADQCARNLGGGIDVAMVCACPGAGKTLGSLYIARSMIDEQPDATDCVIVVVPSTAIAGQFVASGPAVGVQLEALTSAAQLSQVRLYGGLHGFVVSYQAMGAIAHELRIFSEVRRPLVIFDEVHHAGDEEKWGADALHAFAPAFFKLLLSGTPVRPPNAKGTIAFARYFDRTVHIDYEYPPSRAILDRVCRRITFMYSDGLLSWSHYRRHDVSFQEKLGKTQRQLRRKTAVKPEHEFLRSMLATAHDRLTTIRSMRGGSRAGGLIVAENSAHAHEVADLMQSIAGVRPVVVYRDQKGFDADEQIARFRDGDDLWIVAVQMLTEGVDIPRLRVAVWATPKTAELSFFQFCGRVMRVEDANDPTEMAFVFVYRDPMLEAYARKVEKSIPRHVISDDDEADDRENLEGVGISRAPHAPFVVHHCEGSITAQGISGSTFDAAYLEAHRGAINDVRRLPLYREAPDAVCVEAAIIMGRILAPEDAAQ